jgi:Flp pilus assembly protein TadG
MRPLRRLFRKESLARLHRKESLARLHHDERGIITAFLVKLVISFALLALIVVDGTAIVLNRLQADDVAQTAAREAAKTFEDNRSVQAARETVLQTLEEENPTARMKSLVVRTDGSVVVTITRRASTLVTEHIGFLEGFTFAKVRAVGRPSLV